MKRSLILMLLLTALLLCACGEAAPDTTAPQMPSLQMPDIEQMNPIAPKSCSAELNFAEELPVGTVVELRNGETVVASYTVETATQTVRLSSEQLQPGVSYRLTVNGVLQKHSGMVTGRPIGTPPPIGEIPTPSLPPVEEAPPTESAGGFTPGDSGNMGGMEPPEGFSIGDFSPEDFLNGKLPQEPPLSIDIDLPEPPELPSEGMIPGQSPAPIDPFAFRLEGELTSFHGICAVN